MNKNIGKGTEEFMFFGDFYKYLGKHFIPENSNEYWERVIDESNELLTKYQNCDFFPLAKGIVLVYLAWLETKRTNKTGRWKIEIVEEKGD